MRSSYRKSKKNTTRKNKGLKSFLAAFQKEITVVFLEMLLMRKYMIKTKL